MSFEEPRANKSIPVIDVDGTLENADWIKHAGYWRRRTMFKQTLIDRIVQVAVQIGADQHPVALKDLRDAYLQTFPNALIGQTQESFNATLHYFCINLRSRFPDPTDKHKPARWLKRPLFKRVTPGHYMLLSKEETVKFERCVEHNDALVFQDEYVVADLNPIGADAMNLQDLKRHFNKEMLDLYRRPKQEIGYNATGFLHMLNVYGGLETAKRLIKGKLGDNLAVLYQHDRLDLSVEALVLQPQWEPLFTDEDRTEARWRLTELGYAPPQLSC